RAPRVPAERFRQFPSQLGPPRAHRRGGRAQEPGRVDDPALPGASRVRRGRLARHGAEGVGAALRRDRDGPGRRDAASGAGADGDGGVMFGAKKEKGPSRAEQRLAARVAELEAQNRALVAEKAFWQDQVVSYGNGIEF